jgi:hypothetical protein
MAKLNGYRLPIFANICHLIIYLFGISFLPTTKKYANILTISLPLAASAQPLYKFGNLLLLKNAAVLQRL